MNTLLIDERIEQARQKLQMIQAWPHWNEIGLCAQKEYGLSAEQFQARLPEYQRFMALSAVYPGLGMISEQVDQLWHSHILHTALYEAFCENVIGQRIHHLPCSSYPLYGVERINVDDDCSTCKLPSIPSTCYGKARPDMSLAETRQSILDGGQRFREVYQTVFGDLPEIWARRGRSALVEGIAL